MCRKTKSKQGLKQAHAEWIVKQKEHAPSAEMPSVGGVTGSDDRNGWEPPSTDTSNSLGIMEEQHVVALTKSPRGNR